jgi:hypothetical protein
VDPNGHKFGFFILYLFNGTLLNEVSASEIDPSNDEGTLHIRVDDLLQERVPRKSKSVLA